MSKKKTNKSASNAKLHSVIREISKRTTERFYHEVLQAVSDHLEALFDSVTEATPTKSKKTRDAELDDLEEKLRAEREDRESEEREYRTSRPG